MLHLYGSNVRGRVPRLAMVVFLLLTTLSASAGQISEIKRDSMGVPHCYGETPAAMMYAFGYAQAEDHLGEMLTFLTKLLGRSAEFSGPGAVTSDIGWRFLGGRRVIAANIDQIDGDALEIAAAFSTGVNAYRSDNPGEAAWAADVAFDAIDVLAGIRAATIDTQLSLIISKLGRIGRSVCPPGGKSVSMANEASNMWAIAPAMSATGVSQIQGDPHLPFDDTGTGGTHWYDAHLKSGPYDVVGASRFGLPAIAIGSNPYLGWSGTNNGVDNADLYEITVRNDAQRLGEFEYLHDGTWKDIVHVADEIIKVSGGADRTIAVRETHHGPVVFPIPLVAGTAYAARFSGQDAFDHLHLHLEQMRSRNLSEFKNSLRSLDGRRGNRMVATRDGDIWTISHSRQPNRPPGVCFGLPLDGTTSATDWLKIGGSYYIAFDNLPQIENPTCGWMQNSNNEPWYNSCGLSAGDFQCVPGLCNPAASENYRSQVAGDYFESKVAAGQTINDSDMVTQSFNTEVRSADAFIPLLDDAYAAFPPADPNGDYAAAKAAIDTWNRRADKGEVGITLYSDWVVAITSGGGGVSYNNPPSGLTTVEQQAAVSAFTGTVDKLVADYGTSLVPYGNIHTIKRLGEIDDPSAVPPIPRPVSGATQTIQTLRMATPKPEDPVLHGRGNVAAGSSYLILSTFDASGRVSVRRVKPYGNSMHTTSSHYADMTDFYSTDSYIPFPLSDAEVDADMESYSRFDYLPVTEARIPGSRKTSVTCALEWTVEAPTNQPFRDRRGFKNNKQTCTDGDPTCDYDGAADGSCTMRLSLCMNNLDSRLPSCTPTAVAEFELRKPRPDSPRAWEATAATTILTAAESLAPGSVSAGGNHQNLLTFSPAVTTADSCGSSFDVAVALKHGTKKGRLRIRTKISDSGATHRDKDKFILTCLP